MFDFLKGKKSYIVATSVAIFSLLKVFKVLETTPEQDAAIYGLLSALFGMSIRSSISDIKDSVE